MAAGDREVDLEKEGCYIAPQITADNQGLKELCDTMNRCREMTVTYQFGEETEELLPETICSWITGYSEGQILLDQEKLMAYVGDLANRRSTAGRPRMFSTVNGAQVELTGPYGWVVNIAGEAAALTAQIQTGESQTREPVYAAAAASRTEPDWGTTYVEVDIEDDWDTLVQSLLSGMFLLLIDGYEKALVIDSRTYPSRGVAEPDVERVTKGSRDGFVETLLFNANLIRRRVRSEKLIFSMHCVGEESKTDVAVAYIKNSVNEELLDKLTQRIDSLRVTALTMGLIPNLIVALLTWAAAASMGERPVK